LRSRALQDRLLNEAGVAVISGTSFGIHGEGYLRFSYAASVDAIESAIERIGAFLEQRAA
jgi:aspartate/methionine/tyrosine aminotransferase